MSETCHRRGLPHSARKLPHRLQHRRRPESRGNLQDWTSARGLSLIARNMRISNHAIVVRHGHSISRGCTGRAQRSRRGNEHCFERATIVTRTRIHGCFQYLDFRCISVHAVPRGKFGNLFILRWSHNAPTGTNRTKSFWHLIGHEALWFRVTAGGGHGRKDENDFAGNSEGRGHAPGRKLGRFFCLCRSCSCASC